MEPHFDNLLNYFTNVEYLRDLFKEYVATDPLPKRFIVIHGVGGVGKSSLLRIFRIHCKNEKIPVGLASGDETKSVIETITRWMEDLKQDGVKFSSLGKTLASYQIIQAKVSEQIRKPQTPRGRLVDIASKAASKTAETAGGALMGAAIGSILPGVGTAVGGTLGGVLGGMGAEALTDWLGSFLSKTDIDLLVDPSKKLTSGFLEDITKITAKKRIVLILDTFEQMSTLEDWACDFAKTLPANVLMVIAGRKLPNWNRAWPGWMTFARVEELRPMSEDVMRELIQRYYASIRGGQPSPTQVNAIIRFARGLPIVITSAVQLWVKYGVEDFQSVKVEIVSNLVDRLMEGVPKTLSPAIEAAAIVRWFDQPILRALTEHEDVRDTYNELRRFPFIRPRVEGLALHDSVREIIDENLRAQDSERYSKLHRKAAEFFEKQLEKASSEEAERIGLERFYHRICENETNNIYLLLDTLEDLARYRLINRMRILINDFNTYSLELESSKLWRDYYNAQLAHLQKDFDSAQIIYGKIIDDETIDPKIRAFALCEYGKIHNSMDSVRMPNGLSELVTIVEESNRILPSLHLKRAENYVTLGIAYPHVGEIEKATSNFEAAINLYEEIGDLYGVASVFSQMKTMYGIRGDWGNMFSVRSRGLERFPKTATESYVYSSLFGNFAVGWILAGRYAEAENYSKVTLSTSKRIGIIDFVGTLDDLVLSLGFQEKYSESKIRLWESVELTRQLYRRENPVSLNFAAMALIREGALEEAEKHLKTSLAINEKLPPRRNPPENLQWLGLLYEIKREWQQAEEYNKKSLEYSWIGRQYYICAALTSLIRIRHAQADLSTISPLLDEAEEIAQNYEYNDHLASLRLTQGHLAWGPNKKSDILHLYQHAMIHALRYNRFLLDDLLSGRTQGTPLQPIIPFCLERGTEGIEILKALSNWWRTGVNEIGIRRANTISQIPEDIPLVEAEKSARKREPGNGSSQTTVIEQIEMVI